MHTRRRFIKYILGSIGVFLIQPMAIAQDKVKKVAIPTSKVENLKHIGGSLVLKLKGKEIVFIRESKDILKALDAKCTHKGCLVEYTKKAKRLECPCHHSAFSLEGKVLRGPAKRPLDAYKAYFSGNRIIVEIK